MSFVFDFNTILVMVSHPGSRPFNSIKHIRKKLQRIARPHRIFYKTNIADGLGRDMDKNGQILYYRGILHAHWTTADKSYHRQCLYMKPDYDFLLFYPIFVRCVQYYVGSETERTNFINEYPGTRLPFLSVNSRRRYLFRFVIGCKWS